MHAAADAAFLALYEEHAPRLHTYCLRITGAEDDAADALQETFTQVLARLDDDPAAIAHPRAYLYATARHACLQRVGERGRVEAVADVPEPRDAPAVAAGEAAVLTDELRAAVRAAHDRLPERQREVLFLREVEELSYGDIGTVMELSPNGAAQLAWRARTGLRSALRADAVHAIAPAGEDCERARTLLELRADTGLDRDDDDWLEDHLADCERCRASRAVLAEAGLTYRAALPVAALPFGAEDALAAARSAPAGSAGTSGASPAGPSRRAAATVVAVGATVATLLIATSAQTPLPPPPPATAIATGPPAPERTFAAQQDGDDRATGRRRGAGDDDEAEPAAGRPRSDGADARVRDDAPDLDVPELDARGVTGQDEAPEAVEPSPVPVGVSAPSRDPPPVPPAADEGTPAAVAVGPPAVAPPGRQDGPAPEPGGDPGANPGPGTGKPPEDCDTSHGKHDAEGPGSACDPDRDRDDDGGDEDDDLD